MDVSRNLPRPAKWYFSICVVFALTWTTPSVFGQANAVGALEFIGRTGNQDDGALDLFFENNVLYVANKFTGLQIVDVSDMRAPKILSRTPSNGQNYGITKKGNYVYMTDLLSGMLVYDVSNPKKPKKISEVATRGEAWDIKIKDNHAFVAVGKAGLEVFDITDAAAPKSVGSLWYEREWDYARKLFIAESGLLFVADRKQGIHIVDITTPSAPRAIRRYATKFASGICVEGNYAYVADGPNGLLILDVTNPEKIRQVGEFPLPGHANDVYKAARYVYVAVDDAGIRSIDVTNPAKPTFESRFDTPGQSFKVWKNDVYVMVADLSSVILMLHNRPPVLERIADQTVAENETLRFKVKAFDPDGNPIILGGYFLPEGAAFDPKDSVFTWTPTFEQSGKYEGILFTVTENTQTKLFDRDTVAITVTHVNRAPSLPVSGNYVVDENQPLSFTLSAPSDPDGEDEGKLKVTASGLAQGAAFDAPKLALSWTPTFEQSGRYTFTFIVTDASGATDSKTSSITVNHVNRPPVFAELNSLFTVDENAELTVKVVDSDPDKEDEGKLDVNAFQLPQGARFDKATRTLSWTPTYDQSGEYADVTFVVKDPAGLMDTVRTSITVNHVNRPPVFVAVLAQSIDEGKPLTFALSGRDPDTEDAGKLVITPVNVPEGATFNANSVTWTPTFDQAGAHAPSFKIADPAGLFAELTVNVTVRNVNRPPTLATIETRTGDENAEMKIVLPEGVDPDKEDIGKLTYVLEGAPRGAQFDAATRTLTWTPTYDQSESYPGIKATVKDAAGLTASTTFTIVVNHVNRPPVLIEIPATTGAEQKLLSFVVNGSDPDEEDAGKLVMSAEDLPAGATFDVATRRFSWTPTFEQAGTYTVKFKIEDPAKATDSKAAALTITNVNRAPKLAQLSLQSGEENKAFSFVIPDAEDLDKEDAGKLTYAMGGLPVGANFDAGSKTLSWTPTFDQAGTYNVTITVRDAAGLSDTKPMSIKIANTNQAPSVSEKSESGEEGRAMSVKIDVTDPDKEDVVRLSVKASGLPQGAVLNAVNRTITWTPGFEQAGEYPVSITVTDPAGMSDTKTLTLKVNNVNRKPVLGQLANQFGSEGKAISFTAKATDPDKDAKLKFSASGLPNGASMNDNGDFSWTPADGQAGSYSITIEVTDGDLKDSRSISITVKAKQQ